MTLQAPADTTPNLEPARELDLGIMLAQLREVAADILAILPLLGIALVIFLLFFFAARWARGLVRRVSERHEQHQNAALLLGRLAQIAILALGVLIAITIVFPSFQPGDLITLLGIGGVAIGFAFKDIFQNFLAGVLILLTRPFEVGDQIVVGDFEGTVEEIQTRATFIKTYDGRRVVIPNGDLYTDKVTVNTAFDVRRTDYDVGIGYGDDIDQARRLILEAIGEAEGVLKDPAPDVLTVDLAASWVTLRARWWSSPQRLDVLQVQDRVLTAIRNKLPAHGIDLPFETRVVLFHDQTEETDGDRSRQREGWPAGKGEVPEPARAGLALRGLADALPNVDGGAGGESGAPRTAEGR